MDSFIKENFFRSSLCLVDLCQHFCISLGYASRLFRKHLNITFRQRLIFYRVQKAKGMLESSGMPLYLIAEGCGFKSQGRLSEAFFRLEGMPPRKYRQISGVVGDGPSAGGVDATAGHSGCGRTSAGRESASSCSPCRASLVGSLRPVTRPPGRW